MAVQIVIDNEDGLIRAVVSVGTMTETEVGPGLAGAIAWIDRFVTAHGAHIIACHRLTDGETRLAAALGSSHFPDPHCLG